MAASGLTELAGNGRQNGYIDTVIASGAKESGVADLEGFVVLGLIVPTITSAAITFKVAKIRGGTYVTVKSQDASTAFALTASTGGCAIESNDLDALGGYRFIKVVSANAQAAERTFTWIVKG